MKQRLCPLVPHLVSAWLRVSAATSAETVFRSRRLFLNTAESSRSDVVYAAAHYSVCRAFFLEFRRAASIRPHLSQSAAARLVAAMIISRLEYSVFTGVPADEVTQLQRIQNNAALLVMKKIKRNHVTSLLKEHHWLPAKFRCQYKIATLAYRNFEGSLPLYLSSFLCTYQPSRSLRSSK